MKPTRWPCIFKRPEIRADVNPRLKRAYQEYVKPGKYPPYAALQGLWRKEHCQTINPYGSDSCPFEARDCVLAYYQASMKAIEEPGVRSVPGLFRILAKRCGIERADNRPLALDRIRSTNGANHATIPTRPSHVRDLEDGNEERLGHVRRQPPRSIGSLLRTDDH